MIKKIYVVPQAEIVEIDELGTLCCSICGNPLHDPIYDNDADDNTPTFGGEFGASRSRNKIWSQTWE